MNARVLAVPIVLVFAAILLIAVSGPGTIDDSPPHGRDICPPGPSEPPPLPVPPPVPPVVRDGPPVPAPEDRGHPEGARLHGRVLRDGSPVAARVELWRVFSDAAEDGTEGHVLAHDEAPVATVDAKEDGRFEFLAVALRRWELRAVAADGSRASVYPHVHAWEPETRIDIELTPPARHELRGRAVWSDGRPFRGRMSIARVDDDLDPPLSDETMVPTAPDGRFVIAGVRAGPVYLRAAIADRGWFIGCPVEVPHEREIAFVVDDGITWVEGRVEAGESGTPLPGAEVRTNCSPEGGMRFAPAGLTVRTDEKGRFRVPWAGDQVMLSVRAEGFTPFEHWYEAPPDPFVIRITKPVDLHGRVVSAADGAPVAGVPVTWKAVEPGIIASGEGGNTESDEEGRFAFAGVARGRVMVYALGKGWVQEEFVAMTRQEGSAGDPFAALARTVGAAGAVELRVVPAAGARVRVLDQSGLAAAGVRVAAWPVPSIGGPVRPLSWPEGVTDADGRVAFTDLLPGLTLTFEAYPKGGALSSAEPVVAKSGEPADVGIRLVPPRWLEVLVVEKGTGTPVERVQIVATIPQEDVPSHTPWMSGRPIPGDWYTGSDGRARIGPLPPGPVEVHFDREGYRVPRGGQAVPPDAEEFRVEIEPTVRIAGKVTFPDGSPPSGRCRVRLMAGNQRSTWGTSTHGAGQFSFRGVPAGKYRLSARVVKGGEAWSADAEVEAGRREIHLVLERETSGSGSLVFLVTDGKGRPVQWYEYVVYEGQRRVASGDSLTDTPVIEIATRPGPFWVEVYFREGLLGTPGPLGAVLHGPLPAEAGEVVIRLPGERTISGRVVDGEGRPVPGVSVSAEARHDAHPKLGTIHGSARSDATGAFLIGHLGDFTYRLILRMPADFCPTPPVDAPAGTEDLVIRLKKGVSVTLTILDTEDRPLPGARVKLTWPEDPHRHHDCIREGLTDPEGRIALRGLDPHQTYFLRVSEEREPRHWYQVFSRKWRASETVIRIERR